MTPHIFLVVTDMSFCAETVNCSGLLLLRKRRCQCHGKANELGAEAESLLSYRCHTVDKSSLHLPSSECFKQTLLTNKREVCD